ncbi:MAG: hypothetical protein ACTHM6_04190 [Tepidisphaeraceae bacterium]
MPIPSTTARPIATIATRRDGISSSIHTSIDCMTVAGQAARLEARSPSTDGRPDRWVGDRNRR